MAITRQEMEHIAVLARLDIAGERFDRLADDMQNIVGMVDKLQQLDLLTVCKTGKCRPCVPVSLFHGRITCLPVSADAFRKYHASLISSSPGCSFPFRSAIVRAIRSSL